MGLSTLKAGVSTAGVEDLADREARILRTRLRELAAEANARGTAVARFAEEVADLASLGGVGTLRPHEVISAVEYTAAAGLPGESPVEMAEAEAAAGAAGAVRMHYGRFEQKIVVRPARPAEGGDVTLTRPARYLDRWHAAAAWRRRRRRLSGAGRDVGGQDMYLRKTRANRAAARQAGAGTSVLYPAGCGRRDAAPSVASPARHLSSPGPLDGSSVRCRRPAAALPPPVLLCTLCSCSGAVLAMLPVLNGPTRCWLWRACVGALVVSGRLPGGTRRHGTCRRRILDFRVFDSAPCFPSRPLLSESPSAFRVVRVALSFPSRPLLSESPYAFPSRPQLSESSESPSAFRVAERAAGRFR